MGATTAREPHSKTSFLPREHGATAMVLTPIVCAAVLARQWHWSELATLLAAIAAMSAKDPVVVLARQRLIWKQRHPETATAVRRFVGWSIVLILCGIVLALSWPLAALLALGAGVCVFSILAVAVNVNNKQRSTLFQIVSAAALTSSSLATALSATGSIQPWCWWLWLLLAMQATAGILIVHARLDARIAARKSAPADPGSRRAAQIAAGVLACAGIVAVALTRYWITAALLIASAGYFYDLHEQLKRDALQLPLKRVGQRALALSSLYAILLIIGLW